MARLGPATVRLISAERFRELIATAPRLMTPSPMTFGALRAAVPPPDESWPS